MATTWSLAFTRLEQEAPAAIGLLRVLSCCAPEPVPLNLLLRAERPPQVTPPSAPHLMSLIGDQLAAADAVAALRRYSLVTPAGDGLVIVHRLVQAVTIDQMPATQADAWRRETANLIQAAVPDDATAPENQPVLRSLLPHAQAALPSHGPDLMAGGAAPARDELAVLRSVIERQLGADRPDALITRHYLARWTGESGNPTAARGQLTALLPAMEQRLGAVHPATRAARRSLIHWRRQADASLT